MITSDATRIARKTKDKDVANPTVISDDLVKRFIREYNKENDIYEKDDMPFSEVKVLSLSFKNIIHIKNLDGFQKLEKLQLDNNLIGTIENLGHLVNLKWLDLSFNTISSISGLENLVNLTDLSLFSNEIKKLENLEKLTKLNVLSIGNNYLDNYETLADYLRGFKHLQVLNIAGNPFTKTNSDDYKKYILAHLRYLKYLDYFIIDEAELAAAKDIHKESVTSKERDQMNADQEDEAERLRREQLGELDSAYIACTDGLHKKILDEEDARQFKEVNGHQDIFNDFEESIITATSEFQEKMKEKNKIRLTYIEKFEKAVEDVHQESEQKSIMRIKIFTKLKKRVFKECDDEHHGWEDEVEKLKEEVDFLYYELMNVENELFERLTSALQSNFEDKLKDIVKEMVTQTETFYRTLEGFEAQYSGDLKDLIKQKFDNAQANANAGSSDDENGLSKEDLITLADNSSTSHIEKVHSKEFGEEKVKGDIEQSRDRYIDQFKEKLLSNNRAHVLELVTMVDNQKQEIEDFLNHGGDYDGI
mmetsp:Transcript_30910/g.35207  ORF Transcript_30910/g.35207 Transcript_30910/m.35207 type:complete len:534 (+) Transcript_30910:75-1676(+)